MVNKSASIRRGPQPDSILQISRSAAASEPVGVMLCGGLIIVLLLMRFFHVAESADQGETLWIISFWLAALFLWLTVSWRSSCRIAPLGWFGMAVAFSLVDTLFLR